MQTDRKESLFDHEGSREKLCTHFFGSNQHLACLSLLVGALGHLRVQYRLNWTHTRFKATFDRLVLDPTYSSRSTEYICFQGHKSDDFRDRAPKSLSFSYLGRYP